VPGGELLFVDGGLPGPLPVAAADPEPAFGAQVVADLGGPQVVLDLPPGPAGGDGLVVQGQAPALPGLGDGEDPGQGPDPGR